jgi:hypothetical protein
MCSAWGAAPSRACPQGPNDQKLFWAKNRFFYIFGKYFLIKTFFGLIFI